MHQNKHKNQIHIPVLADEVLSYLKPRTGESFADFTAGYGGHAAQVVDRIQPLAKRQVVLVDRDQAAVAHLAAAFKSQPVEILHSDFLSAARQLAEQGRQFDLILADLGVSSLHVNEAARGFSFGSDGPLDMRMDQDQELTAEAVVNSYSEEQLTDLLRSYGEEPRAHKVAQAIVKNRPFTSTTELADTIEQALRQIRYKRSKIHPATKSFQALRIAVNDELTQLAEALPIWLDLLKPDGRLVVISFHSLEDRIVKQTLAERAGNRYDADLHLLTKSPVTARPEELVTNPRARSAKLRAVVKTKNERSTHADYGKK